MDTLKKLSWLERVEELIHVLEGSTIAELELTEAGTEITIRRQPELLVTAVPATVAGTGAAIAPSVGSPAAKTEQHLVVSAPLTGVYYTAASPASPPFVNIGDVVHVGQVVALVEAMKVFNEITAEVAGRVVAFVATNGSVVQKGEVLLRLEPA